METSHANQVELRNLQMEDYDQLARSFKRIYADSDVFWTHAQIKKLITIFPEGQVVIIVGDKIVGCALSIIVDYDMVKGDHTYAKVTGDETFNTHIQKEIFYMVSRCLYIPTIVVCVWHVVCMSIVRNCARS